GRMGEQKVAVGETVEVGTVIATIEDAQAAGETTEVKERETAQPATEKPPAPAPAPAPSEPADEADHTTTLSPAVRRAVLEHGVDPSAIKGTGKDGRLTKEDVLAAAKAKKESPAPSISETAPAPTPAPAPSKAPDGERRSERVKMTRMRQTIARRLKGAQEEAALLTTF